MGLEDKDGAWIENEDRIGEMLIQYYSSLFASSNPSYFNAMLDGVEPRVTEEMNEVLLKNPLKLLRFTKL